MDMRVQSQSGVKTLQDTDRCRLRITDGSQSPKCFGFRALEVKKRIHERLDESRAGFSVIAQAVAQRPWERHDPLAQGDSRDDMVDPVQSTSHSCACPGSLDRNLG